MVALSGGHELFNLATGEVFSVICHFVQFSFCTLKGLEQDKIKGFSSTRILYCRDKVSFLVLEAIDDSWVGSHRSQVGFDFSDCAHLRRVHLSPGIGKNIIRAFMGKALRDHGLINPLA